MKKVFAVAKVAAFLTVLLFFTLFITTCGGGAAGGAGGASIPENEYTTHNPGGWGGGGSSGGGGGSGGGVNMTGGTPLVVERYEDPVTGTFAGSQLNDLIAAIQNNSSRSNSVFYVPFYVVGDPVVRQARVTKGRTKVEKFEHQYKATCSIPPSTITSVFYYYVEEGINLASITTAEMTGWQCQEDGSVHNGSHITNITGDVSLVPVYASGAGPVNAGVLKTDLHTAAIPDVGEIWDYAQQTSVQDGTAYITVPPPPMTALYNENGSAVTWSGNYVVNININSTPIEFTFSSGETQSKQITNIPVGATISASATINVTGSSRYASLTTPQLSTTIQAGGNLDMYFSYPYTCHIPSSLQSYTVVSGVNSGAYKNNGTPTDISSKRPTPESFEYNGQTLYFIGWSRNAADTVPEIAGDSIPANGTYHGALDFYAIFSSCSVSISIHDHTGMNSNIIAENSQNYDITLTATPAGDLPENSTYTWTIESPSSNPPVSLPPGSGTPSVSNKSITVTPVTGRTGTATIKVTATDGAHTASSTINVIVAGISLDTTIDPIVIVNGGNATITASVTGGYSGGIDYSWNKSGNSVSVTNANNPTRTITATEGGKATITVGATLTENSLGLVLSKTIDVYVLDLQLTGSGLTQAGNGYGLMTTMSNTAGTSVSASLDGPNMPATTFTWAYGTGSSAYLELDGTTGTPRKITPKAAGTGTVTVSTSYGGVTVSKTINVSVVGLSLTEGPIYITKGGTYDITASVPNYGSGITYEWSVSGSSVTLPGPTSIISSSGTTGLTKTVEATQGGKSTITVTATITATNTQLPSKTIDIYGLDFQLTGTGLTSGSDDANYNLAMTTANTSGIPITAQLAGTGMPATTFTWTVNSNATDYIELQGTDNNTNDATDTRTVKPKAAGSDKTFTVSTTCAGITLTKTIHVNVAGLELTCNKSFDKSAGTGTVTAEVVGYSGTPTDWTWQSTNTNVATAGQSTPSGNQCTMTLNFQNGGKTTVKIDVTVGSSTLHAEKEVYILDLQLSGVDASKIAVSDSGSPGVHYDVIMPASSGTQASLTANLVGFTSDVSFTWSPVTNATINGTGGTRTIVTDGTTGAYNFTIQATYDNESITKTVKLYTAGLTLTGNDTLYWDPNDNTHILSLALTPVGGISLDYITGDPSAYSSSNTSVATASLANSGATCYVNGQNGGSANITVKAKISGTSIILTGIKQVTILKFNITGLSSSPTELQLGQSRQVTAVLNGAPDPSAVTYTWQYSGSDLVLSATTGSSITVTPMSGAGSPKTLTVTATISGTDYGPIQLSVMPTQLTTTYLSDYISNLPAGNREHPNVLPAIQGLTIDNWTVIKTALQNNNTKYVDLSATTLPEGITDMNQAFMSRSKLVKPPTLPSTVTKMDYCFSGCTNLTEAPAIPAGVTTMAQCFYNCYQLTTPPQIPANAVVTDMSNCFSSCENLETAPQIPASVTNLSGCFGGCSKLVTIPPLPENGAENMSFCFAYCSSLENAPAIPTTVTDMTCCFQGCSKLETAPAIPAGVQDLSGCFQLCEALKNVPVLPDGIIDMMDCFERCTSLENAPIIPASVKEMRSCFARCPALKGTITLNTILPDHDADGTWMDCFKDCNPTNIEKIIVRDSFTLDKVKTYGIYVEQAALRDKVVIE